MPLKYIAEMFCDRVGACKAYLKDKYTNSSPLNYALSKQNREKRLMSQETYDLIMYLLKTLSEQGEDYICKELKERLNK